jgi:hypothetical protein
MKLTVCLAAVLTAWLASFAGARGAAPDAPANPYASVDPDGVPLAVTQDAAGSGDRMTKEQEAAYAQQQAELDNRARNWLMLQYEQRFQQGNTPSTPHDRTMNMYLQLSMNRDLSQVVAQDMANSDAAADAPSFHAAPGPAAPNHMALRTDTAQPSTSFTPLISPLSSPLALAATQPYDAGAYASRLPPSLAPINSMDVAGPLEQPPAPKSAPAPAPQAEPKPVSPIESIDMETPGAIADKSDPLPGAPDLSLDSLPDQSTQAPPQPGEPPVLPELPQTPDASLLHEEITQKLAPPRATLATAPQEKQAPPAKPLTPPQPEAPAPISQQPQISPVHAPVPSPFDILNH